MPISRHTQQRQLILLAVKAAEKGLTPDQVLALVKRRQPRLGRATVYRNLEALVQRGEIYRFEDAQGNRRFIGHVFHEAEFRCQRCGQRKPLPDSWLPKSKRAGNQPIFLSQLTAQGLCSACVRAVRKEGVRV